MEKQNKQISEDHICPICLTVFLKPIYLQKCKHILCQHCIDDIVIIMNKNQCPLCRTLFQHKDIIKHQQLWEIVQKEYPEQIKEKLQIINQRIIYKFLIGNTTIQIPNAEGNKYEWGLFIRPVEGELPLRNYIDSIKIRLHHTFNPSQIIYMMQNTAQINLRRKGWGIFNIQITVYWKTQFEQKQTQFNHYLRFDQLHQSVQTAYINKLKK